MEKIEAVLYYDKTLDKTSELCSDYREEACGPSFSNASLVSNNPGYDLNCTGF